jgi:hypothetical protein
MELAQTTPTPEKRSLYLKMASVWHQMALRWEKKDGAEIGCEIIDARWGAPDRGERREAAGAFASQKTIGPPSSAPGGPFVR